MLFPIGISNFEVLRNEGYAYVDKTELIYQLTHTGRVHFLSRPRRFGKSLLLSTIEAYFSGRRDLFQGLAIEKLEQKWDEHIVFRFSFVSSDYGILGELETQIDNFLSSKEKIFGITPSSTSRSVRFQNLIKAAYEKSGRGVVVLIDEYDKPLLDTFGRNNIKDNDGFTIEEHNRRVLRTFYNVLKDYDEYLKFVMLTGITKFSQVSVFSGLNNLKDISMRPAFDALCGITQEELTTVFREPIAELAEEKSISFNDMLFELKKRYDGYHFSKKMTDIYNPFSLLSALDGKEVENYWFSTGTPTYLIRLLNRNSLNIQKVISETYSIEEFAEYRADYDRPVPMLYQSGYLTIKSYDPLSELYTLDIPNQEVSRGFLTLLLQDFLKVEDGATNLANKLSVALRKNDLAKFFDQMISFLASVPYTVRRKSTDKERESYFQLTFYLILRMLTNFSISVEQVTSQGRIDCVVTTETDVYIFEFKLDGTVEEALAQIEAKGYGQQYATSGLTVHKIGVNFSSESGTVESWGARE